MALLHVLCLALAATAGSQQPPSLRGVATGAAAPAASAAPANASAEPSNESASNESTLDVAVMSITEDVENGGNSSEAVEFRAGSTEAVLRGGGDCSSPDNYGRGGCALYRMCHGRTVCVIGGYMVVPGAPLSGMEEIDGGSAGRWDFLWSVARGQCGSDGCVLITNPVGHRTQEQMHIHFRHYNGGGAALKKRLEGALCGTSGWRPFGMCGGGKARLFDGMPGVFSAVAGAYGGGSLANVGITVWFTSACGGGQQVMVLATSHCSIEHSISAR